MSFLEILTRHCDRPGLLKRNQESLAAMTSHDWTQTLLIDDEGRGVPWANANLGEYAPHLVGDYVWILDDDDVCTCPELVDELKAIVAASAPHVIVVRGQIAHLETVPDDRHWKSFPQRGQISMSSLVVRRDVWQRCAHALTAKIAADVDFAQEIFSVVPAERIHWHDRQAFAVDRISAGARETGSLAIITAVCNRPERLRKTLAMLAEQVYKVFDVHLINNNPALREFVDECVAESPLDIDVTHNAENRGSYARIEKMHELSDQYQYFITIDDDMDFPAYFTAAWWSERALDAVKGWAGFRFTPGGDYWQRDRVRAGGHCHMILGKAMLLPASVALDSAVLALGRPYWMCDDLWLCYFAKHVLGLDLIQSKDIALRDINDGKDVYRNFVQEKIELLDDLRGRGWHV